MFHNAVPTILFLAKRQKEEFPNTCSRQTISSKGETKERRN
jgi:hypothetical protein